jgi:peptidoglycan/xylan/chitin deacetylase (PgdA/CDA1 family)
MQIIPAKTPGFVKSLFPNLVWNISTDKKELYLTFDDGPTPIITDWLLDLLSQYNAKGTFFCIGNNIEKNPQLFLKIIANGHAVGNHTYNHLKGWKHKTKNYIDDIQQTNQIMNSLKSNDGTKLFRPPYGKFKSKQSKKLQALGYKIIMWDVLSYDWDKTVNEEDCLNNIISSAKEGSIIVMHDSIKASKNLKAVLPKLLKHYTDQGFVFKALP